MNSKILIPVIFLLITSCGLKKYPKAPAKTKLPDITEKYKFKYEKTSEEEQVKKKTNQ